MPVEVLDEDLQMVRDALASAPEYAKGHFENLVEQYEAAAARCEELKEVENDLEHTQTLLKSAEDDVATLEEQLAERDSEQDSVLTDLKYWFLDVMVHGRPVTDPRKMLRKVEAVL